MRYESSKIYGDHYVRPISMESIRQGNQRKILPRELDVMRPNGKKKHSEI